MSAAPLPHPGEGFPVNPYLTGEASSRAVQPRSRRRRESVENDAFTAFCARIIRAAGRRIAEGDVEALPDLIALQVELDQTVTTAVQGLRSFGYSWGEIASRLGTSRQAAQQRWGTPTTNTTAGAPAGSPGEGE